MCDLRRRRFQGALLGDSEYRRLMGGKTGSTGAEHVEASMAVMSMAEDSASGSLAESIPNPAKNYVQV